MNTKEQASQLRLAAGIIETGHPYEIDDNAGGGFRKPLTGENPGKVAFINGRIRIILATPPDGRPLNNPDNLTAEQVGVGYRLTVKGEQFNHTAEKWQLGEWTNTWNGAAYSPNVTYRLPLSVPWPALPIATLAKDQVDLTTDQHAAVDAVLKETIHVEPFQLPAPPPGIEWHRKDGWNKDDLPRGYRPLRYLEHSTNQTQACFSGTWIRLSDSVIAGAEENPMRTTRPLTFTHLDKEWTWHKAGDPMPCERARTIHVLFYNGKSYSSSVFGSDAFHWGPDSICIGWRYAEPATKTVDLGPEDVPPGSVFRCSQWSYSKCWLNVRSVRDNGVELTNDFGWVTWHNLAEGFQINRPANRDADGYPTKWEPCSKEVPA